MGSICTLPELADEKVARTLREAALLMAVVQATIAEQDRLRFRVLLGASLEVDGCRSVTPDVLIVDAHNDRLLATVEIASELPVREPLPDRVRDHLLAGVPLIIVADATARTVHTIGTTGAWAEVQAPHQVSVPTADDELQLDFDRIFKGE